MTNSDSHDERVKIWQAWSSLFLDSELEDSDCERIAKALAASPFSREELDHILRYEVAPICGPNLLCMVGEWAYFDNDWLNRQCLSLQKANPFTPPDPDNTSWLKDFKKFRLLDFTRLTREDYERIMKCFNELRADLPS